MGENLAKLLSAMEPESVKEARENFRSTLLEVAGENAIFKAKVAEGNRITIPDAERESTGLEKGDLVQVVVIPLGEEE